jgi:integrase
MGLGSFPTITLADAREKARVHRTKIAAGQDPILIRRQTASAAVAERAAQQTFASVASQYVAQHEKGWKNKKHGAQWTATLETYAAPIVGRLLIRDVTTAHVIRVLEPIWLTKTETATRVRSRMELVLDFAAARGLREGLNPARWRGNLDAALPKPSKVAKVQHHAALDIREMVDFMARLNTLPGNGARALEFAVFTAARSGEVRGAKWMEIDLLNSLWTIPAARMKSGREHRVPLSRPAIRLLRELPTADKDDLVFPGVDGQLSDMTLTAVLRRMKVDATVHGFRSTFRDWISESTAHSTEVAEMALSHAVGDKVEAAYRRGDLFEKRVALMSEWGSFLRARNLEGVTHSQQ